MTGVRLLVPALISLMGAVTHAQEFIIGVEDLDYFPYYSSSNGQFLDSPSKQLLDRFARQNGYTFVYTPLPVARLTQAFIDAELDFKFPDSPDWAQEAKSGLEIHYSDPIFHYTDGVMVIPDRLHQGLDSFKALGTVRGFTPWSFASLISQGHVQMQETSSLESVVLQALYQRVDGAYFNIAVANWFLTHRLEQPDSLVFDITLPHASGHYTLSSIQHPEIISQFNDFLLNEARWIDELQPAPQYE